MRLTIPVGSAQGALDRGIPQLGNFSTEEFLGSGVSGHPRVVSIQGWFLAGLRSALASHSAVPCGTNVKRINANRAIRIAAQRTQGSVRTNFCVFEGDMTANKRQRLESRR